MASLGRRPGAAPLTSADIPDDSITAAKIVAGAVSSDVVYLENNTSAQELSGTYSTERLYFNDSYRLTGNVNVTGHLALGSIADEDIVITQDGTERTITGAGTLEAGNVLQDTHRTSLTDMTGELGSVVTGSPNLNLTTGTLGSGVTFPVGHVIQTITNTQASIVTFGGTGYKTMTGMVVVITPTVSTSKILVTFTAGGSAGDASISYISAKVTGTTNGTICENVSGYGHHTSGSWLSIPIIVRAIDLPGTVATQTYQLHMHSAGGSAAGANINYNGSSGTQPGIITAMEIAV